MSRPGNKFLKCFRPMCPDEQKMLTPDTSATVSGADNSSNAVSDGRRRGHQKTLRGLRRVAKVVLFDASLLKMIRRKKSQPSKKDTLLTKMKEAPNLADIPPTTYSNYSTPCHSLNSSATTISRSSFSLPSGSPEISTTSLAQNRYFDYKKAKHRCLALGLFLFVVCLLICWGKVCAILCTSAVLALVPRRAKRFSSGSLDRVGSRETNSKARKKSNYGRIAHK